MQISDSHISLEFAQRTGDLAQCVEQINFQSPTPDIAIHTGDIADYGEKEQYAVARQALDKLNMPYFVTAGNRDSRPNLLNEFSGHAYLATCTSFIQYSIEDFATRILVLDTLYEGKKKGQLCPQRLEHLQQMLAADTTRPVTIFMHHPPFEATEIPDPFQYEDWSEVDAFWQIVGQYDNVQSVYCGHLHRNIDARVGAVPVSSVSCAAGDLRWGVSDESERALPMFRLRQFG